MCACNPGYQGSGFLCTGKYVFNLHCSACMFSLGVERYFILGVLKFRVKALSGLQGNRGTFYQ